ncbi:MAG: L,D-transpeptidase family protein [bacterium]|nr:L,D-transpeptidase family protein [bacterium]
MDQISIADAEGNISRKRGIFIHGSNSLKSWTFGKNASSGCIRMHPANRDVLEERLIFGRPYKRENGKRIMIRDLDNEAFKRNNKILFEKTQRHKQEYYFTA